MRQSRIIALCGMLLAILKLSIFGYSYFDYAVIYIKSRRLGVWKFKKKLFHISYFLGLYSRRPLQRCISNLGFSFMHSFFAVYGKIEIEVFLFINSFCNGCLLEIYYFVLTAYLGKI